MATSTMITMPSAMRYQTNGMKLLVEMNFMNHAITAYPVANAITVAKSVGPQETCPPSAASYSSNRPDASTAGMARRNE